MAQLSENSENQRSSPHWRGYLQIILILAIIAVALILARAPDRISVTAGENKGDLPSSPVVSVIQPEAVDMALPVKLTGNVAIDERVKIISEARGRVVWLSPDFHDGGIIPANQPILRVDPTIYQLQLEQLEHKLALKEAQPTGDSENTAGDSNTKPRRSKAMRQMLETKIKMAKHRLAQTEISLPYEIRVIRADVTVGEVVGPYEYVGQKVSIVGVGYRLEDLIVSAPIEPKLLENMDSVVGRRAVVTADGKTYETYVERVSNVVAPETRLTTIYLKFSEDSDRESLPKPGTFAQIMLDGPTREQVYVLPLSVMQTHESVWIVDNDLLTSYSPHTLAHDERGWVVDAFDSAQGVVVDNSPDARLGGSVSIAAPN